MLLGDDHPFDCFVSGHSQLQQEAVSPFPLPAFASLKWAISQLDIPRLITSLEQRHSAGLSKTGNFCFSMNPGCLNARSFATDAVTQPPPQLDDLLRILNDWNQLSYEQIDSALQGVAIPLGPNLLGRSVLQQIRYPETAFNFFVWVVDRKGFRPNTVQYNALLEILGSAEKFSLMSIVVKRMDDAKCKLLPSTFTILIKYYGKAGLVDEATKTLTLMKKCQVEPNVQTYNNLMHAFLKEGRLEVALGIFEQMLSAHISPNEYTINFLTDGLCKAGKLDEAKKFVSGAPVSNIFVYNVLLKGFCSAGKVEEAYKILEEMTTKRCFPDEYTYNTLVVGSCKAGKLDFALKLRQEMIERNIAPTVITYGTLITFLCKGKREKEAFQLLENMMSDGLVLAGEEQSYLRKVFSKTKMKVQAAELLGKWIEKDK